MGTLEKSVNSIVHTTNMLVKLHLKASGLKKMDALSKSDPYFTITVKGAETPIFTSAIKENNHEPEWDVVEFNVPDEYGIKGGDIEVALFDKDVVGSDDVLASPVTIAYPFRKADHGLDTQGTLTVVDDYGKLPPPKAKTPEPEEEAAAESWYSKCLGKIKK